MKKTAIAVVLGFALVWLVVALIIQRDTARIRESEQRAEAIHKKTMAQDEERWKATLERIGGTPSKN